MTVAGLTGTDPVVCSRNVKLVPDKSLDDAVKEVIVCFFNCLFVCLFNWSLRAESHLGPDGTRLKQMLKPGLESYKTL